MCYCNWMAINDGSQCNTGCASGYTGGQVYTCSDGNLVNPTGSCTPKPCQFSDLASLTHTVYCNPRCNGSWLIDYSCWDKHYSILSVVNSWKSVNGYSYTSQPSGTYSDAYYGGGTFAYSYHQHGDCGSPCTNQTKGVRPKAKLYCDKGNWSVISTDCPYD